MGKRIRHPKNKKQEKEIQQKQKLEQEEEHKTHFVLNVHDSTVSAEDFFGR